MPDYEKIAEGVELSRTPPEERKYLPVDHPKYQGLAEAKGYDQSYARIQRTHYSHEAMIDEIIANPNIKQNELATKFGKSVPWISRIIGSDAFQAALAKRREDITDPFLIATVEERFKGLAFQSLDIIAEKLETTKNTDLALKALDVSVKALGFGARGPSNAIQNNFVVQLPLKSNNSEEWLRSAAPTKQLPEE
jgi:hypothetical protein